MEERILTNLQFQSSLSLPRTPDTLNKLLQTLFSVKSKLQLGVRKMETRPLQPALVNGLKKFTF